MSRNSLALDRASCRHEDENGFLHVGSSHITKATVNPYYGREIPGWRELGLDPEKIYYGLRDARELEKSAASWNGLPLHMEHHVDSADNPKKLTRVGAVGASEWKAPYVNARLTVWDGDAIDAIENGTFRELSCSYRYDPDFTPGSYEGVDYDFVMRNIRGNHVALVEEGRAGPDVLVADAALDAKKGKGGGKKNEGWASTPNGKKFHYKNGMIDKGNVGQKDFTFNPEKLGSLKPNIGRYNELLKQNEGNHVKAAKDYFREVLQGKYLEAQTDNGPIRAVFTGSTWQELKNRLRDDSVKAELFPYLPEIIATGKYKAEPPAHNHPELKQFHTYTKTIKTSDGDKIVIVDVGERKKPKKNQAKNEIYSMTKEGDWNYEIRKAGSSAEGSGHILRTAEDSAGNDIRSEYEVVNIRFADEADNITTKDNKTRKLPGGIMGKFKKWFRGAKDSNPDVERDEVDLAQAIIDLHKVDPNTGEIVDITEDEDKAVEIRKVIGEISGKLEPEEIERLNSALSGLAYAKATGDGEPDDGKNNGTAMDEDMKKAMDECGLDSDDEDAQKAFAEGVKYGERLEANPEEREKLDKEHESAGMKKAMDACGLDSEDSEEAVAFAEGVKYGEKKAQDEEAENGEKTAQDDDRAAAIERIVKTLGIDEDKAQALKEALAALVGEKPAADDEPAKDAALRRKRQPRGLLASDAALIRARAVRDVQENFRRVARAINDVKPLVGELDPLAFDSASDVYGYALQERGINPAKYERGAWRGMVDMLRGQPQALPRHAMDGKNARLDGPFAGLNNISIGD